MTKLGSILKNRNITLVTKIHIVNAFAFPIVMYRYECSTTDASQLFFLEKTLESPLISKEINTISPKGNHPEYLVEGLML